MGVLSLPDFINLAPNFHGKQDGWRRQELSSVCVGAAVSGDEAFSFRVRNSYV